MDLWPSVLKMAASLAVVLGLMALAATIAKRAFGSRLGSWGATSTVRVLGTHPLGGRREIAVVAVEGERLVLGLTPTSVSLLARLEPRAVETHPVDTTGGRV